MFKLYLVVWRRKKGRRWEGYEIFDNLADAKADAEYTTTDPAYPDWDVKVIEYKPVKRY